MTSNGISRGPSEPRRGRVDDGNLVCRERDLLADDCELVRIANGILKRRRQRSEAFSQAIFGEPAWDILLELFVRESSGLSTTGEQLISGPALPQSTLSRWIRNLENQGLVYRRTHPVDHGTDFIALTKKATDSLRQYLVEVANS